MNRDAAILAVHDARRFHKRVARIAGEMEMYRVTPEPATLAEPFERNARCLEHTAAQHEHLTAETPRRGMRFTFHADGVRKQADLGAFVDSRRERPPMAVAKGPVEHDARSLDGNDAALLRFARIVTARRDRDAISRVPLRREFER